MNNELYSLVNELNFKKNTLDNNTKSIMREIRDWCIKEEKRIDKEYKNLNAFVTDNFSLFWKNTSHREYTSGEMYLTWNGLDILCEKNSIVYNVKTIGLDSNYMYKRNIGETWSNLPKPTTYRTYDYYKGKVDKNNADVTYWTDYKKVLAIRNEVLCNVTKLVKDYLGTLILEQDNRFKDMRDSVDDIAKDNIEKIEISIRRV